MSFIRSSFAGDDRYITMDTAKDFRILVLEDAIRRLNDIVGNRKLKMHIDYSKLTECLKTAGSLIYEVKYSYIPGSQLADLEATSKIVGQILSYKEILESALKSTGYKPSTVKDSLTLAEAAYAFRIGEGFQRRMRGGDDPEAAVDILAVEISQIQPIKDSKNLSECRCTDGSGIWHIMTNINGLSSGVKLACAVLPPVEMMGRVSEAMFLGSAPLPEDTALGLLESPPESALNQARAQVLEIVKRMV